MKIYQKTIRCEDGKIWESSEYFDVPDEEVLTLPEFIGKEVVIDVDAATGNLVTRIPMSGEEG